MADQADKGAAPVAGDARASLLDAIRRAGGSGKAKLKSVAERKVAAKKKKEVSWRFSFRCLLLLRFVLF